MLVVRVNLCRLHKLDAFPVVGSNTWLSSWWAGFKYLTNAQSVIQEGYNEASPVLLNCHVVVTLNHVVQICTLQDCGTQPLDSYSGQPRTPGRTG